MGKQLTPDQRDERKWSAARMYLQAYADWQKVKHNPLSQEAKDAWLTLMAARRRYKRYAN